ncbi:Bifunctional DNA primase/polymerase [Ammonifex degensii KC4]|uniref:Bifunctional DNA primase/polymerase n=1 Tax=Ammonifex degensii (strain DSM 10501 / KC4) TaxID=429009 RepID=C9R7L2_AMMDK|nr:bifunctional DNA primase/polymerase [Ammonifex degensii]ACX52291.1 Bifunctional DNA primase/polymerase [Ammonifex degensii KC4]
MNELAEAAVCYAERFGWAVLPLHSIAGGRCTCGRVNCPSPGKHPLTQHGVKEASKDSETIAAWWRRWPWANIGVATGSISGFFVLDVDGPEGEDSLYELVKRHGELPETVEQITGSGGRHLLFRMPEGRAIGNKVRLAPGLDVRGEGGYVVAAPSLHASGRRYEWEFSSRPGEVEVAEAPGWLLELLAGPAGSQGRPVEEWRQLISGGVEEGQRNNSIAALAGHLLRKRVDPYVALDLLLAWNQVKCRPPLPDEEVVRTVDSIAKKELERRLGKWWRWSTSGA